MFIGYICHFGFLWDFYMSFHSLSHFCYAFGVLRVYVRVLWDPMLLLSRLICIRYERWITYERWVTFYSGLRIIVLTTIQSLVIWLFFIVQIWVDHHSFHFLIALFYISSPLSRSSFHLLSIPYILTHISSPIPSTHHPHVSLIVWPLILPLFQYRHFLWLTLSPWLMRFFYALHLVHKGMGLIIGYLSQVSLHFFHPITLAYVTSHVLRPPWGHEIRRYLWQFSLGQAFVDWLKYSRYYVFSYGRYFWKHLLSLLLGILMLMDFWVWRQFIDDIGFIILSCIRHPHWGIFPFFYKVPSCCWMVWLSLFTIIEMLDWFWQILYRTSNIHTRAYSSLLGEIMFRQRYIDGWSLLVVYLTTSTSDIILGHIPLSLVRFCLGNSTRMDDRCWLFTA